MRTKMVVSVLSLATAATGAAVLVSGTAAHAQTVAIHISGTGGQGVRLRTTPNTSGATLTVIPEGAAPPIDCATTGENINGVSVWMHATWNSQHGYYASYYDDSHYSSYQDLYNKYGIPQCGASTPAPPPPATTTNAKVEQAINWMQARMGSTAYDGYCLAAVYQAYLSAGVNITAGLPYGPSHNDPYTFWAVEPSQNRHTDRNPPRGALIFFRSYSGEPGHITISLGSGQMISTYDGRTHGIHTMALSSYDPSLFLGWVMPAV